MHIEIYPLSEDLVICNGITVVIDVFRAFSVACYILEKRPNRYIPVSSVEIAFQLQKSIENSIIIGEQNGTKLQGFSYGNSPTELIHADIVNSTIIHTTSGGTKGLYIPNDDSIVLAGSFVNLSATIRYIKKMAHLKLSLLCTGSRENSPEDYLCANYIKNSINNKEINLNDVKPYLKASRSGKAILAGTYAPPTDFDLCLDIDRFDFIIKRKISAISGKYELVNENT